MKAVIHRPIPDGYQLKSATISQEREGNYYCSFLFEYEEVLVAVAIQTVVGLDYKSNGLYMTSEGKECSSPKYYRKSQERLAKAQCKLKQMQKHSCNYLKQQQKIARIHRQEANQRKDFLHKRSTEIATQYNLVCVESLNMRNLSNKGFGNGKALEVKKGSIVVFNKLVPHAWLGCESNIPIQRTFSFYPTLLLSKELEGEENIFIKKCLDNITYIYMDENNSQNVLGLFDEIYMA